MKQPKHTPNKRQSGATLVVALIFMVILALLGASAATTNGMQERMASNTRNRDLAFQAAELAVRAAESNMIAGFDYGNVATVYSNPPAAANRGLWIDTGTNTGILDNSVAHWAAFNWTAGNNAITPPGVAGNGVTALYTVERLNPVAGSRYYRITARGTGPNNAISIIQTIYRAN